MLHGNSVLNVPAIVKDHCTVWPAIVVDQTKVGEQTDPHRLQTFLIAHHEAIAVNLVWKKKQERH